MNGLGPLYPHKLIQVYDLAPATYIAPGGRVSYPVRCWALVETDDGPKYGRYVVPMVLSGAALVVADVGGTVVFHED